MYLIFWSMIPVLRICLVYSILCLDWVLNMQFVNSIKTNNEVCVISCRYFIHMFLRRKFFYNMTGFFLHNYGNIWKHRIWILDNFDILIDIDFCENNITENVKWLWVYLVSLARAFFYYSIWWNWALYLYLRPSIRLDV